MAMSKPYIIFFAGTPGSSKTPTAHFLSWNLGLPILSNDAIRREVKQDTLDMAVDSAPYLKLRDERIEACLKLGKSFIYDASVDRTWFSWESRLQEHHYQGFIVSFDLSQQLLDRIAQAVASRESTENRQRWYQDHQDFLSKHRSQINLSINDQNFADRMSVAVTAVRHFLAR
jgi:predicted kinase